VSSSATGNSSWVAPSAAISIAGGSKVGGASAERKFDRGNLIAIVQFCAIGLLIKLISMLSFPDLGAIIVQYNQF
jgi:hypothetical protein